MPAKGLAVCIGLDSVDPKHYQGWSGPLGACEADAADMAAIATEAKIKKPVVLLTAAATRAKVIARIKAAADDLKTGDFFLLTYSGHGGQLPDRNEDEEDGQDETWCLFDGELVDDELYELYLRFKTGVRILVLSDSCHSGTVTRAALRDAALRSGTLETTRDARVQIDPVAPRYRAMPDEVALATYRRNRAFYDPILLRASARKAGKPVKATVRLISGCQDNQLSSDGTFNGLFTGTLLKVWRQGKFAGDYQDFHKAIVKRMPSDQTPKHFLIGAPNPKYDAQKPFTVT